MKSRYIRITIEILVWTGFIIFPLILFPTIQPYVDKGIINPATTGIIITHSLLFVFYYFNYYYALPHFYFTRKYKVYFPLVLSCLLLLILIMLSNKEFNPLPSPPFKYARVAFMVSIILRFLMMLLLSLGFASYNRLRQAEEEKLKSELSYLKAQINPHFLFNTLNSIYALAVKKSDSTPESITKLASIMRYVITDAAQETVALEKEINYVSAYIELEKLRLTSKVKLNYILKGNFVGKQISPMIFIPLIENTFKHGVSTSEEC
jgi:sensor histidine kinase YesM